MGKCLFLNTGRGGELLSIAASIATIKELKKPNAIPKVHKTGSMLKEGCRNLIQQYRLESLIDIIGLLQYTVFDFKETKAVSAEQIKTLFIQEAIKRHILTSGYSILSLAHNDKIINETLNVYENIFSTIKKAIDSTKFNTFLECPLVENVFTRP